MIPNFWKVKLLKRTLLTTSIREASVLKLLVSVLVSEARVVSYYTFFTSVSVTLACSADI